MNTSNKQAELERKSDIVFNAGRNEGVIEGLEQGYAKALDDVKKVIDVHLDRKHKQLENKELPELTQANISGMIIALIITKEEIAKLENK